MNEATKEFFGYLVEIDCGEEGRYKGKKRLQLLLQE
jgi:hypothetical protein